jgi:RimJ/RimL family protein N-acetyltransferase
MSATATQAPNLETERLTLRGHALEDYQDCLALWSDPEVARFIGGKPSTPSEVWLRLLRYPGHWSLLGYGFWVARERSSGRFVGELGFADNRRDLTPSFGSAPEIGYALASWSWGRGYATEAARAVVAWGDVHFGPVRTWALINPLAQSSIRVAEKCGYRECGRANYFDKPVVLLDRFGLSTAPPP